MVSSIPILYKFSNKSFWFIDGNLTRTFTPGRTESGSNGNEQALHTHQSAGTEAPTTGYSSLSHQGQIFGIEKGFYPSAENIDGVF